jgi:glucan phosphoethanolaminetransferase (alkaline phosphatase superfamily)
VRRAGGGRVRIVAIVFFVLLAAQLILRYARPEPPPAWSRVAVIACCVGVIACLVIQFFSERATRSDDDMPPASET